MQHYKAGGSKVEANAEVQATFNSRERRERNGAILQHTSAPSATKTVTPGLGYTVTQDPAQIRNWRKPLPLRLRDEDAIESDHTVLVQY